MTQVTGFLLPWGRTKHSWLLLEATAAIWGGNQQKRAPFQNKMVHHAHIAILKPVLEVLPLEPKLRPGFLLLLLCYVQTRQQIRGLNGGLTSQPRAGVGEERALVTQHRYPRI